MDRYLLFNDDIQVAAFSVHHSIITDFTAIKPGLLPMQLRQANADRFTAWLRDRAIDLNNIQHRNLMHELIGSRDKTTLAIQTHMFSLSDTFTCFPEDEFIPRQQLADPSSQNVVSNYILISSDTSLRNLHVSTPNASTDGSFTKTWRYEDGNWWLYKLQSPAATRAEVEISLVLREIGWDAAVYEPVDEQPQIVKSLCFVKPHEFFEPYDSFRFFFENPSDDDQVINQNFSSLGAAFIQTWKRILLSDALFANGDRHMRNFGVIRSSVTGEVLRLAPNFDNNQAFLATPGGRYYDAMLRQYMHQADDEDFCNLKTIIAALKSHPYLDAAYQASLEWIK